LALNEEAAAAENVKSTRLVGIGLVALLIVLGCVLTVLLSSTIREQAAGEWEAKADREAQAMTSAMLGWLEESYAPLTALAVLFEYSMNVSSSEFLGATDALESKTPASFLDSMAIATFDADNPEGIVTLSNDAFGPLPPGLRLVDVPEVQATVQTALAEPGRHVLGPPAGLAGGRRFQPVALATESPSGVYVMLGVLRFDELVAGLFAVYGIESIGVSIDGRFETAGEMGPPVNLVDVALDDPLLVVPARSLSGSAELFINWQVAAEFDGGPADDAADLALTAGFTVTVFLSLFVGFLLRQNRVIRGRVAVATRDLRHARDEAEAARETAEEGTRAKSAFLANMSHELRTPMNAIIGYSEMLAEEFEEEGHDSYLPDLGRIQSAAKHLLSLINDILDLSKVEAGRMDLYLERFDLDQMLEECVSTVQPLMDSKSLAIEMQTEGQLGSIRADVTKLRQTLLNLLSNAAKFTHEGKIVVAAERFDREGAPWIRMSVRDTGIGIPEDKLDNIFQEFTQADVSTTREYGGTGLGLAISKRFIEMMGGNIAVSSVPGEGSTFSIEIPAQVDALEAARASLKTAPDGTEEIDTSGDGPLVLIIEDDADARAVLARTLSRDGYQIAQAENGERGVAMARELKPALITLDVMMPGMDGWAVLRELKSQPELRDIPIVMVTIVGEQALGRSLGASDYLQKPVDRSALLESVRRLVKSGTATVLVVDDDTDVRELLRRALEQEGMTVVEAENGEQGLARISESMPDLVLLDLMMPVMDGFEFLQHLPEVAPEKSPPVIVLTAKILTEAESRELRAATVEVLSKGTEDADTVAEEVRRLLNQ
jgi:signal transduction histidine kinase/DNA-binding response OmpR family regulator